MRIRVPTARRMDEVRGGGETARESETGRVNESRTREWKREERSRRDRENGEREREGGTDTD